MRSNSFLKIGTGHLVLFSFFLTSNAFSQHPDQQILLSNWQHTDDQDRISGGPQNLREDINLERWYANSFMKTSTDSEVLGWNVTEVIVSAWEWWNHGATRVFFPRLPISPISDRTNPPIAIYDTRTGTLDDNDESLVPGEPVVVFEDEYDWRDNQQDSYFLDPQGIPTRDLKIEPDTLYWIVLRGFGDHAYHPWLLPNPDDYEITGEGAVITTGIIGARDLSGGDTVNSEIEWQTDRLQSSGTLSNHSILFRIWGTPILLGDLNNDLERDIDDYLLLNFHLTGFRLLPTHFHDSADVNRDGEIDMTDLHLLRFLARDEDVMVGDLNDDERVNLFDLVLINDHISGTNALPDELKTPADIKFDFMIDDKDRSLLIDLILER